MIGTADGKLGFMNIGNLQNFRVPDSSGWYDIIEMGSKFTCSTIRTRAGLYAFGCLDGRCAVGVFEENRSTGQIRPVNEGNQKIMMSKSQKK